ncbi:MAG TPA: amidase family protein [Bacilli bacterium]|nr:amidase family protein [Bacilli bacterium]
MSMLETHITYDEAVSRAKKYQDRYNSFVTIIDDYQNENSGILKGIPYALKDNLSTKGIITTASSNMLKDYIPSFDATVYEKLKASGAMLVGKTVLDELAMGGTGTTGHTGIVKNPWDEKRMIGGSSSGSASAVALGIVPFAIGSDTGDSIRKPASYAGVVGFKPTYGRVSRYGLFAFASSLDHVGCLTRNVLDSAIVIDTIKGHDKHDLTSLLDDDKSYRDLIKNDINGKKGFYLKEIIESIDSDEILDCFNKNLKSLKDLGVDISEVSIDKNLLRAIYPAYITISSAEATSNNSNLTGLLFGPREEQPSFDKIMMHQRTIGFSNLIKRRFVLGSYVLQKENQEKLFLNAQRIRRMVVNKINELFKQYDFYILPATSSIAPLFDDEIDRLSDKYLIAENHLVIGNFGGYPSITIPNGFVNKMPIGINITSRQKEDEVALSIAYHLEQTMNYKDQIAGDERV